MILYENEITQIKEEIHKKCPFQIKETGKLIRSRIGVILLKAINSKIEKKHIKFLTSIELIHNASLLHDDVIDNEDFRRNTKTINALYNNKTAILYGNLTLSSGIDLILELNQPVLLKLINNTIKNMCEGELLQQSQIGEIPTIEEYIKKTKLKTASLFEAMIQGILLLSNSSFHLKEFGTNYGIAFQIKNDLEDYKKGINNSSDIKNKIYTAPFIYSRSLKYNSDAIEKTTGLIDNYSERAIHALKCIRDSEYKNLLIGVIKCLTE